MKLRKALHLAGAGALTGALLLGTASVATADDIRDRQWALDAFAAQDIWEHSTGKGVIVAVVDTGVDATHPDLKGQVLDGKDFSSPTGSAQEDTNGHGTGLASLIAGQGHGPGGEDGVKGLAPDAKILPVRVQHEGSVMGGSFAEGVKYAVDQGADVINISQVTWQDADEEQAVEYAIKNGVIVVAGTGNEGRKEKNYPASYPGVVSVGGVNGQGEVWEGSSWGSNTTLLAPATDNVVANTNSPSGYRLATGTSDSTAYVSAAAALVIAEHPDLSAGQVINRLVKTAKVPAGESKSAKLPDEKFGYGIVRPFRAVTYDIPAGPKEGPLAQSPEEETSTSSGSDDSQAAPPSDDASAESESGGISPIVIGVIVVVGLGILGLVIGLVVKSQRKKQPPLGGSGPGGPAPQWPGVPPQQPGQQKYPPQAGQFNGPPASPPPPPNQPPRQ